MILATYLPIFRAHELHIFRKNIEMLQPDQVVVCVDYFFNEKQHEMLRPYLPPGASLIVGNWRNRTSCLLRLVKIIAGEGDGVVVDSDVILSREFIDIDRELELPIYHVADSAWRHARVVRVERRGDLDVYYWRLKALWSRYMQVFVGPKHAIRIKRKLHLQVEPVLDVVESMDPLLASLIADETTLGVVYDKAGIEEVPFVVASIHHLHDSYPKAPVDKALRRRLYAKALFTFFRRLGYWQPALRYLATYLVLTLRGG
jgi:hypothetical protein